MYTLRIKRWRKGKVGTTRHVFDTEERARDFADGYKAALTDVGRTDLYVLVYHNGTLYYESDYNDHHYGTPIPKKEDE